MFTQFDNGDDLHVGDGAQPDTGTERPEVAPNPVSPLTEQEWLSSSWKNPLLLRRLGAKAAYTFSRKMLQKRRDAVQESLEKMQDLAIDNKSKSPAAKFDPIKQTRHVFGRVMRSWKTEERGGKARILSVSVPHNSGVPHQAAKPSIQERQAQAVFEKAFLKLSDNHQKVVTEWNKPGVKRTVQEIADICSCTRGTVSNALNKFEHLVREAIDDDPSV